MPLHQYPAALENRGSIPVWETNNLDYHLFGRKESKQEVSPIRQAFHIRRLEEDRRHITFPLAPHRKAVYDLIFLLDGKMRRSKALKPYEVGAGSIFFLPAFQLTSLELQTDDIKGYYCHFDLAIFAKWMSRSNLVGEFPFLHFFGNPVVEIGAEGLSPMRNLFRRLYEAGCREETEVHDLISTYLLTIFAEAKRFYAPTDLTHKTSAMRITENYLDALARNIYDKQLVSEYAKLLKVSPNHLNKCVKRTKGRSAQDLLNHMLILEAKVLLNQTNLKINEIAYRLTRKNPSDFSRFFKANTGMTPREYRRK